MNYKQKIIINIILIPILASVLFTIEPIKVYWTDNIIKNVIFSNDLGKGEIVFRVDSDRIAYTNDHLSHVIMKYENEYVYFQSKTFNDFHKGDQGGTHINKVDFYDGIAVIPMITGEYTQKAQKVVVISLNDEVETIKLVRYTELGNRLNNDTTISRSDNPNIFYADISFLADFNVRKEYYTKDYTVEGYDKDGNLVAQNKCANQRRAEYRQRQVSE